MARTATHHTHTHTNVHIYKHTYMIGIEKRAGALVERGREAW